MSEWKEFKLNDIAEIYNNKRKPLSSIVRSKRKGPFPYYGASGIVDYIDDFIFDGDYVLISEDGENLRSRNTPIAFHAKGKFWVNNHSHILKGKERFLNDWIIYYLKNLDLNPYLTGAVQPKLNKENLLSIPIRMPDMKVVESISEILTSLDDKIELNNKINQELENLAQTLFKQWFIDFEFPDENGEPYQSSGGEMVESELGMIPKGWGVYSMSDLLQTVSKTYPLKTVEEVVFLNTGDIQDGKFLHENISDPTKLPGQAKKSIAIGDILYSEIRPQNKRFAFVHFDTSKYVVSTKLMVLRTKVEINSLFQYFVLTQKTQINYLQRLAESRSGTFPQITFSEVSTIKIALPSFDKVGEFVDSVLQPFYDFKFSSEFENQELKNLRDTLLPKLISGEINVKDL